MNIKPLSALLCTAVLALSTCATAPAMAQSAARSAAVPANRFAAAIVPAERFEIGGVLVERHAGKGRPLILIPGLGSGSWAWQDTIRAFAGDYPVYVLTLPGFDGRPAGKDGLAGARTAVARLIAERRLAKPVIVGHSLGATLGLAVAEDLPDAVGGVVAIDGLPVFPGTEDLAPAQRAAYAQAMRARMAAQPPAQFAAGQRSYMRTVGVLDMDKADALAELSARSDPAAIGQYAADALDLDLRPGLTSITAPVLAIVPWFDLDATQQGLGEQEKADYYRALLAGTPRLQVVTVAPARHFAMIDEPARVEEAIRAYLKTL
ncbi:alpha/beta hydrolase [Massilia forsythiae]|uniref:Alpha/beta hydrolase n=1 Tax=Massilia forsythiae TaxID=2728020 RepID=A0A7Z2W0B3_9BURK|nr:alpha/beta hydrolase [Massilia forsythiae]QJE02414.1 alpha/beta hydrolase [Massilia forsythiae]